jgi:argininosuccinate lyase
MLEKKWVANWSNYFTGIGFGRIIIDVGNFVIEDSFEDVHSKIEYLLTKTRRCWKKIHTARSRNDQVLVDVHLYLKDEFKSKSK